MTQFSRRITPQPLLLTRRTRRRSPPALQERGDDDHERPSFTDLHNEATTDVTNDDNLERGAAQPTHGSRLRGFAAPRGLNDAASSKMPDYVRLHQNLSFTPPFPHTPHTSIAPNDDKAETTPNGHQDQRDVLGSFFRDKPENEHSKGRRH